MFEVIKASIGGLATCTVDNIDKAAEEITYHGGWDSLKEMRDAIKRWGEQAKPGDTFKTAYSVIVRKRGRNRR